MLEETLNPIIPTLPQWQMHSKRLLPSDPKSIRFKPMPLMPPVSLTVPLKLRLLAGLSVPLFVHPKYSKQIKMDYNMISV